MNCWEGCIARVVIGMGKGGLVQCLRVATDITHKEGPMWECEALQALTGWDGIGSRSIVTKHPGAVGYCADAHLRPVPPDELRDVTPTEESLPCHAL